jgi:hypothetical protein
MMEVLRVLIGFRKYKNYLPGIVTFLSLSTLFITM